MKTLYTLDHYGDRMLVPFDSSRTCGELEAEVSRRLQSDADFGRYRISGLRVNDRDGPRLFRDDILVDVVIPKSTGHAVVFVMSDPLDEPVTEAVPKELSTNAPETPSANATETPSANTPEAPANSPETPPAPEKQSANAPETSAPSAPGFDPPVRLVAPEAPTLRPTAIPLPNPSMFGLLPPAESAGSEQPGSQAEGENAPEEKGSKDPLDLLVPVLGVEKKRCVNASKTGEENVTHARMWEEESDLSRRPSHESEAPDEEGHWSHGQSSEIRCHGDHRIEWVVPDMQEKMREFSRGMRIFSPEFRIYGIPLSLVFYPTGNTNAKPGYCSLGLKAPHGCRLRYKLFVGGTERYTELRHNVTESWGFVDMCCVEDEPSFPTAVGVEIISDIGKDVVTMVNESKVEWTLHGITEKMKFYKKDVAIYSQEFSLAGVDKLRIKFYPNGKKEAENDWCSLYLEAPRGSEIRVRLSVGKKSMSFDRIEKFGEDSIWGFLTLCKILDEVENDEAKIGVEILETKRLDSRLTETEDSYLKSLPSEDRNRLLEELTRIERLRNHDADVPSRFRILNLTLPDAAKAIALQKWDSLQNDVMSGESSKLKKWIDGLLALPLGKITRPVVSLREGQSSVKTYLDRAKGALNSAVFGHEEPKEKILQLICQWISNPDSMSLVMGIQGPPGNGKTSLCRKGIAEALGRPFVQISLGGATDGAVLEGHSFTYVGSTWGRIAQMLMDARSMNPVIFFDELDKVSQSSRGDEIVGVLTHLTDHSQNSVFTDRYFEGIPMDMSKAMFIFSFNDESKINSVLKDRLTIINTDGFKLEQQLSIARMYLLPELLQNVGMKPGDIIIEALEDLQFLCDYCGLKSDPGGVRGLKKALEACVLHANKRRLLELELDCFKAEDGEVAKAAAESPCTVDTKADLTGAVRAAELTGESMAADKMPEKVEDNMRDDADDSTTAGSPESKRMAARRWSECESMAEASPRPEETKQEARGAKKAQVARKKSLPKFELPLKLTKDSIEWLLPRRSTDDRFCMMYT